MTTTVIDPVARETALEPAATSPPAPDPYHPHRGTLLAAERVRALSELRPWRAVCDVAWCWALIGAAWTAVALYPAWWVVMLAVPVIGNRYYALFIIGHDGMHRRVLRRHAANDLFCDAFIYGPIGAITRINNRNHLLHHRHLATDLDPDRHKHACFSKADRRALIAYVLGISSLVPTIVNVFVRRRPSRSTRTPSPYSRRDVVILLAWPAVLVVGLTWAVGWWGYPVLWLVPVYALAFLGDNLRSFAEHSHPEADDRADEHRLITYLPNPIERAFIAPMSMNYHAAHHLWPSIPYYNLARADREMRRQPDIGNLEWRRSYVGYLLRYWRALPLEECRK